MEHRQQGWLHRNGKHAGTLSSLLIRKARAQISNRDIAEDADLADHNFHCHCSIRHPVASPNKIHREGAEMQAIEKLFLWRRGVFRESMSKFPPIGDMPARVMLQMLLRRDLGSRRN